MQRGRSNCQRRQLTIEALDQRLLLSGDMTVSLLGGDLVIRGDAEDNQVDVSQPVAGIIRLEGRDGTTINGEPFVELPEVVGDLKFRMQQGGEDDLFMSGPIYVPDDLSVRMREGVFAIDGTLGFVEVGDDLLVRSEGDVAIRNQVRVGGETTIRTQADVNVVAGLAATPDFASAAFDESLNIDNPFFPLVSGTTYTYEEESIDDETGEVIVEDVVVQVLADTETILGVEVRVVRDTVSIDGVVIEDTFDYYAQDNNGNVWYFGEDVTNFEYDDEGNLIGTNDDGAWIGGVDGALPGVLVQANPQVGARYYQEVAVPVAIDQAEVLATGETATAPVGTFHDVLRTKETTILEPDGLEHKLYAPGLGQILGYQFDLQTGEIVASSRLISVVLDGQAVTQVVDPSEFVGTNAAAFPSDGVQFGNETRIRAGGSVIVIGTTFVDEVRIRSMADVSVIESIFEDELRIRAADSLSFRDVSAEDEVTVRGDIDVYVFDSTFLDEVEIRLGAGDNSLVVSGSLFDELEANGGAGNNTFEDWGGNNFDELELRNFDDA